MRDGLDKSAIEKAITAANNTKKDVKVSADGSDVVKAEKWVTNAEQKALTDAIAAAEAAKGTVDSADKVTAAATALDNAVKVYDAAKKAGSKVGGVAVLDKSAINTAIEAANNAKKDVKVSADGSDVVKAEKWVTNAEQKALTDAIAVAEAAKGTVDSADKVTAAATALDNAVKTYTAANKAGTKADKALDKSAIEKAIVAANTAKKDVKVSADGSEVVKAEKWVTNAEQKALTDAIAAAEAAKGTVDSADKVTAAATALDNVVNTYKAAKKDGLKS